MGQLFLGGGELLFEVADLAGLIERDTLGVGDDLHPGVTRLLGQLDLPAVNLAAFGLLSDRFTLSRGPPALQTGLGNAVT